MKTTKNILYALITLAVSAVILCGCNSAPVDNSPDPQKKNPPQVQANKKAE